MKRTLALFGVALLIASGSLAVSRTFAYGGPADVTVKGEIIDEPCYVNKGGAHGEAHKACGVSCAKRGNQLAVLEEDSNTVYLITGDYSANKNEKLIPFVAEIVEATGTVTEKDGKKYIEVTSIKKAEMK
jgi:type 1 fimbria pilin